MSYSQVPDVRGALSPDGDPHDPDTPSSYSDEQIMDSIHRADAQIDLYLRAVYTVPVVSPDTLLQDWSSAIAAYLTVLVQAGGVNIDKTDPIQLRYDRALSDLRMVAAGTLVLGYPIEDTSGPDDPYVVNHTPDNLFPRAEFFPRTEDYFSRPETYDWPNL